jgi:hypothetical protein
MKIDLQILKSCVEESIFLLPVFVACGLDQESIQHAENTILEVKKTLAQEGVQVMELIDINLNNGKVYYS